MGSAQLWDYIWMQFMTIQLEVLAFVMIEQTSFPCKITSLFIFKGLASYCKAETTFTFHFPILTLSSAFLSINNREMKSESGFSFAMASKPFHFTTHRHHHPSNLHPTSSLKNFLSFMKGSSNPTRLSYNSAYLRSTKES